MSFRLPGLIAWCLALPTMTSADDAKLTTRNATAAIGAFNDFSWKLFSRVGETNSNLVISPIGVATLLAIAADGARGETHDEIVKSLGFESETAPISELMKAWKTEIPDDVARDRVGDWRFAQSIWLDTRIHWDKAFATRWTTNLGTDVRPASFARAPEAVARAINEWSDQQTKGAIKSIVNESSFDRDTSLFLVSAVFLEKKWDHQFKPNNTKTKAFHLDENNSVQHPLMFQMNRFHVVEAADFQAIQLPYRGSSTAMVVLLPRQRDGLAKLEATLDSEQFSRIWSALQKPKVVQSTTGGGFFSVESKPAEESETLEDNSWDIETQLTLPQFYFRSQHNLNDDLKKLGVRRAFERGAADFSGLHQGDQDLPIFVTGFQQHAMIEVDEQGTRAAAVTGGGFGGGGAPPKRAIFCADHPFLFVIVHRKTGAVLFLGRVRNPSQGPG